MDCYRRLSATTNTFFLTQDLRRQSESELEVLLARKREVINDIRSDESVIKVVKHRNSNLTYAHFALEKDKIALEEIEQRIKKMKSKDNEAERAEVVDRETNRQGVNRKLLIYPTNSPPGQLFKAPATHRPST